MRRFVAVIVVVMSAAVATANFFPQSMGGAAFQITVMATSFIENFTRGNSTDISTGAPSPPGTWTEFTQGATSTDCEISIGTNELVWDINNTACQWTDMYAFAEYGVGSADHCVSYKLGDISNWQSDRGSRGILRYTSTLGNHYELRGTTAAWNQMRVEVMTSNGTLISALTANGDCSPGPMSSGDRVGLCVNGSGDETVFTVFAIDAADVGSIDIEDATTWGVSGNPVCTLTAPFDAADRVETGDRVGVGFNVSAAPTTADTASIDDFAATASIYQPPNAGPVRSAGLPTGVQLVGTTSIGGSLTTGVNSTCKWDTTAGVVYASMANTFAGTGTTSHTTTFGSLVDSTSYTRYVKCTDGVDPNFTDYLISFSVDNPLGVVNLFASPATTVLNLNWDDSLNVLDHDHWNVRHKLDTEPTTWTNDADVFTSDATITGLTNDVLYDVEVRDCDSTPTCSAWAATTGTPAVPPVSANEEIRCTQLGGNCVCSEPMEFDAINMADGFNFPDTDSTKECFGTRSGTLSGAGFSVGTNDTGDISGGAGWGNANRAIKWDNGYIWLNTPNVSSGPLAITTADRTYCTRYYMKVTSDYATTGGDYNNPNGACPNTTWRNKIMQNNWGYRESLPDTACEFPPCYRDHYAQIQLQARGSFSCPVPPNYTDFIIGIGGEPDIGSFGLTGSPDARFDDCVNAPCRFEMCVDGNLQAGTNLQHRARVTALDGSGAQGEVTTPTWNSVGPPYFPSFWGGDFFHSGGTGSAEVSHFMAAKWQTDNNDWIGPACEIETTAPGCP